MEPDFGTQFQYSYGDRSYILKVYVLEKELKSLLGVWYHSLIYSAGSPELIVQTNGEIPAEKLAELDAFINTYVDPAVYLELVDTRSYPAIFRELSGEPIIAASFVNPGSQDIRDADKNVMSAFKTIVEYKIDAADIAALPDNAFITFELVDDTRKLTLETHSISLESAITEFRARLAANPALTGNQTIFKSFMVEGLRNHRVAYDCIWYIRLSFASPADAATNIHATMHSIQALYYDIY